MYPQQSQPGQSPHAGGLPQQWSSPPPPPDHQSQPGPNGQLPPHPQYNSPYPPRPDQQNIRPDRPEMTTVNPPYQPQPDQYRLPAPSNFYQPHPMPYGNVPPQQQPQQNITQSAPRQRTAIACKYCRRRKIRCSGFENSEDGRCTNCVRFSQECVFTPVSHQTQAFVPAQAVYGRGARGVQGNAPPQLYGAFGQRLPAQQQEAYQQAPPPQQGYNLPSPNVPYPPPPQQAYGQPYGQPQYPPQPYDPQSASAGSRRGRDEPHTPTLPPPNPGPAAHMATHREPEPSGYAYPDPTGFANGAASPASSATSYQSHPQPYYAPQPPRRNSPGSANFYEQNRESSSPHGHPGYTYGQPTGQSHAQMAVQHGRTPPPNSADGGKNGLAIRDIVSGDGSGERRSAADSDMVSALDRTNRR